MLDADTIFLNTVTFTDYSGNGFYNTGSEYHPPYFTYMDRLIPWLHKVHKGYSGICHHMLFQRIVLEDLFNELRIYHEAEPWIALCQCIDKSEFSGLSEYEIYFNFVFTRTDQMKIRPLKWKDSTEIGNFPLFKSQGYHYVSCHTWMRQ